MKKASAIESIRLFFLKERLIYCCSPRSRAADAHTSDDS